MERMRTPPRARTPRRPQTQQWQQGCCSAPEPPPSSVVAAPERQTDVGGNGDRSHPKRTTDRAPGPPPPSEAELRPLRLAALHRRAVAEGINEAQLESALESGGSTAKETLIALILRGGGGGGGGGGAAGQRGGQALRAELESLKLVALHQRATQVAGVDAADGALEAGAAPKPKMALIELIVGVASVEAEAEAAARAKEQALREELAPLGLMAVFKRAIQDGVAPGAAEGAMDGEHPKVDLIALIVGHLATDAAARAVEAEGAARAEAEAAARAKEQALRDELAPLGLMAVFKRAIQDGVAPDAAEGAMDGEHPKADLIALIVGHLATDAAARAVEAEGAARAEVEAAARAKEQALRDELAPLGLMAVFKRAIQDGVAPGAAEGAMDGEHPKADLIALIVGHLATDAAARAVEAEGAARAEVEAAARAKEQALREELAPLGLMAVFKRAIQDGVVPGAAEGAMDGEHPKADLIALIVGHLATDADGCFNRSPRDDAAVSDAGSIAMAQVTEELARLKLGALQQRALDSGIDPAAITVALDNHDPKATLLAVVVEATLAGASAASAALEAELWQLRLGQLQQRARDGGMAAAELVEALDDEDPKQRLIHLLLQHAQRSSSGVDGAESIAAKSAESTPHKAPGRRAHHAGAASREPPQNTTGRIRFPGDKWCMLSYNWELQDNVKKLRENLQKAGVPTWMDVSNLYSLYVQTLSTISWSWHRFWLCRSLRIRAEIA
jgi:hypothetical protein